MKAFVLAIALLLAAVGCGGTGSRTTNDSAVITGGVIPCAGMPVPNGPHYAAGTVTVLRGQLSRQRTGYGVSATVFPKTVVAQQTIATDATYRFAVQPGHYVLDAHFAPPANVVPFVSTTVYAGEVVRLDIPNMCK